VADLTFEIRGPGDEDNFDEREQGDLGAIGDLSVTSQGKL
jgi:hypothetical protein